MFLTRPRTRGQQLGAATLALACLAIGLGIWFAHRDPAGAYELSIYRETTILYWVGIAVGVTLAIAVAVYDRGRYLRGSALATAGVGVASITALPLVRGYHYYGLSDALTHLGQARYMAYGTKELFDAIYPAPYTTAILVSDVTGMPLRQTMLLVVFLSVVLFLVFVPLCIQVLFGDRRMTALAAFSGLLVLPINNVSTALTFHPFSLAMLYSPLVLYLLFKHLTRDAEDAALPRHLTAAGLALFVATAAMNFKHPQMTVDLMAPFGAIVVAQVTLRRLRPSHPLARTRAIYGQFVFLAVLFLVWSTGHWKFGASITNMFESLQGTLAGQATVGADAVSRSQSAQALGANVWELFLKIFGVTVVYLALAGGLFLAHVLRDRGRARAGQGVMVSTFALGGLALAPYFVLQSLGSLSNHLFRHLGFVMIIATLMGAVALARLQDWLPSRGTLWRSLRPVAVVLAVVLLVTSMLTIHASPQYFKSNRHVSEQHMNGFEASFEQQPDDASVWFGGIARGPGREKVGLFASPTASWEGIVTPAPRLSGVISATNLTRPVQYYRNHPELVVRRDHYIPVTDHIYQQEVVVRKGIEYSADTFATFAQHPEVYRVRENGDFTLYYVDTECDPVCPEAEGVSE